MSASPPPRPPADQRSGRWSRRFYLPAALLVVAGVERVVAGRRGPGWLVGLGVVLVVLGLGLAVLVARARRRR